MRISRKTTSGLLTEKAPFFWIKRAEELLSRQRIRRKAEKNRSGLLRLGRHLLQDLGFDPQGCPLRPDQVEKMGP